MKYSIQRFVDPQTKNIYANLLDPVDKVETPDDYTVRVTTKTPYPSLLEDLGRWDQADTEQRSAIDLLEPLVREFPHVPDYRNDLAKSLAKSLEPDFVGGLSGLDLANGRQRIRGAVSRRKHQGWLPLPPPPELTSRLIALGLEAKLTDPSSFVNWLASSADLV